MSNYVFVDIIECRKMYERKDSAWICVRMQDGYSTGQVDIPTEDSGVNIYDNLGILEWCKDFGSDDSVEMADLIDYIIEEECSVTINGTEYSWDEIKHLFGE